MNLRPCSDFIGWPYRGQDFSSGVLVSSNLINFAIILIMNNYAYVDNQNLYLATKNAPEPWSVDMKRFRIYLLEKYKVERAYLFIFLANSDV